MDGPVFLHLFIHLTGTFIEIGERVRRPILRRDRGTNSARQFNPPNPRELMLTSDKVLQKHCHKKCGGVGPHRILKTLKR